jgi:hypothetical protein
MKKEIRFAHSDGGQGARGTVLSRSFWCAIGRSIKFYAIQCFKGKASAGVQNGAWFDGALASFRHVSPKN